MYGCESWTVKKAEHQRIDAFELWCWRRLLRVPWTARRSNQCILKDISPGISLEGMMLKLKLQYFGHLMWRVDSLEKTHAGRDWGQEEKGMTEDDIAGWHRWLEGRESEWTPQVGDRQGGLACCDSWGRKESDTTERLIWSDLIWWIFMFFWRNYNSSPLVFRVLDEHPPFFRSTGCKPIYSLKRPNFVTFMWHQRLNSKAPGYLGFIVRLSRVR